MNVKNEIPEIGVTLLGMVDEIQSGISGVLKEGNQFSVNASMRFNASVTIRFSGSPIDVTIHNDPRYIIAVLQTVSQFGKSSDKFVFEIVSKGSALRNMRVNKKTGSREQVVRYAIDKVKYLITESEKM